MRYTRKEFEQMIDKAIGKLSPKARKLLEKVPVILEKRPGGQRGMQSWGILGQFSGARLGQSNIYPPLITIYQEDVEFANRQCEDKYVVDHLSHILAHELLHYLGANEQEAGLLKENLLKLKIGHKNEKKSGHGLFGFHWWTSRKKTP
jgi:predicted Zn-dependent protease with MMP-like domain